MIPRLGLVVFLTLGFILTPLLSGTGPATASSTISHRATALRQAVASLPISFERNMGQVSSPVRFLAHGPGFSLYLTPMSAALSFTDAASRSKEISSMRKGSTIESHPPLTMMVRLGFVGASSHPDIVGVSKLPGIVNYFVGNDPREWHTDIPTFARVEYKNLYPGIDLVFYSKQGHLEYDWVLQPGADPDSIKLDIAGTGRVQLARDDRLAVRGTGSEIDQARPFIYQTVGRSTRSISGHYVLTGPHEIGIRLGPYDRTKRLVIDPVLAYSTYLGGSSAGEGSGNTEGFGIATDASGAAFITGYTDATNFPTTPNAYQSGQRAPFASSAFVTKLGPSGHTLVYSTYLGGSVDTTGQSIAVDGAGNAYVTGWTESADFPLVNQYQSNYDGSSYDAFVSKLSPDGTALLYSTRLGGSNDDYGFGIAIDGSGDAYVTGRTQSRDFPKSSSPFQSTIGGGSCGPEILALPCPDAFMTKLNTTVAGPTGLLYSTYIGGSGTDVGLGISVDGRGYAYITGSTTSPRFPTTPNAYQTSLHGPSDAFVTKLNPSASGNASVLYSSYLGGSGDEDIEQQARVVSGGDGGIAVDASGNAYITGSTSSADFPTKNQYQGATGGGTDAFVAKIDTNAAGPASLVFSTYLGGTGVDEGFGIALDGSGDTWIAGLTNSARFPTINTTHTTLNGGTEDAFVAEFDPSGGHLLFSTYLGGSSNDYGTSIAADPSSDAYVTGLTLSTDFPTANPYQPTLAGCCDAFVTKFAPGPTAARVSSFTADRAGPTITFRWRVAEQNGIAAFDLYAGHHRLNLRTIPPHVSRSYRYRTRWIGSGPFSLRVILSDGQVLSVGTR